MGRRWPHAGRAWTHRVHLVLACTALESRGTVAEMGGAAVNADASFWHRKRLLCLGERDNKAKWVGRMCRGPQTTEQRSMEGPLTPLGWAEATWSLRNQ